ncbi:MAG: biopolymer transporter ExbD [Holophagaceae bacterium]|nr:biopolymer transporter ExbD [Holophagaceae bacterium]
MSAKTDINVTPLIDIVLVLLIIFIIMVPGMQKSLPTVVPQVTPDKKPVIDKDNPPLVLDINQDNSLAINQSPLEFSEIPDILTPLVLLQPAGVNMRKIFLNVDRDVPYKWVVQVMDQLRVTSDRVKRETLALGIFSDGYDGGETKIIVKQKRRPGE